jgi:hypothetical protein
MSDAHSIDEYITVDDAARRWPDKFTREELMRAARQRRLEHVKKGRRRLVTEAWLNEYLDRSRVKPWHGEGEPPKGHSSSGDTGSAENPAGQAGIVAGMTPEQEESAADLLARKIMKTPSAGSPPSS